MKAPYQPLFWGDHYAETRGLTFLQSVIYIQLQGAYWTNGGPLDADEEMLIRAVGCSVRDWQEGSKGALKFFRERNGKLVHARLDAQLASAARHSQSLKERGKKGGKASVINRVSTTAQAEVSNNGSSIPSQAKPIRKKEVTPPPPKGGLEGFEDFWSAYSRHDSRRTAEKAWPAALKTVGGDPSILARAAKAYSRQFVIGEKSKQYQALAATWLNGERWNDPVSQVAIQSEPTKPEMTHEERMNWEYEQIQLNPPKMMIPAWFKG
jgi:uncharacterized protein YdaU (DUF1376 family)